MSKRYKIFILCSLIIIVSFISPSIQLFAEEIEEINESKTAVEEGEKQEIELGPEDPMYGSSYGVYKGDKVQYTLDIANPGELEEKGFFSNAWDFISLQVVDDKISETLHYSIFFVVDMSFKLNVFMTNVMLAILNFAYNTNIINVLIENTEETIRSLTGISGTRFGNTGLFGGFLGFIALLTALFTLYQFIVKKASISAFSSILRSIFALTLALLFFSNYADVLKGAHSVSTDLSAALLSGSININVNETSGVIENTTVREKMNDNIFTMFVHRPYLMLQYGTTIEENIGSDRVEELLTTKKGEERTNIIIKEVMEKGNETLTYAGVVNRLVFAWVMTITNMVSSSPIYLLALFLIVFQFWFLVIALIAPFVFLWSALPNQFGVLKRYFFEMSIPLLLKMGLSVIALVIFGITDILYNIDTLGGGTQGYIITTLLQSLILFTLFLLRKRIFNVFSMGSRELNIMRDQMNSTFIDPTKKGVSNTLTTGGALVGAVAAGPQGAMLGANIGGSLGNAVTGESDLSEMTRGAAINMMVLDRMNRQAQMKSDNSMSEVKLGDSASINNEETTDGLTEQHFSDETIQSNLGETTRNNIIGVNDLTSAPIQDSRMNDSTDQSTSVQGSRMMDTSNDRSTPLQGSQLESTTIGGSSLQNQRPILDSNLLEQTNQTYIADNDDPSVHPEETNLDTTNLND